MTIKQLSTLLIFCLFSGLTVANGIPKSIVCNMGGGIVEFYEFDTSNKLITVNTKVDGKYKQKQVYKFKEIDRDIGVTSIRAHYEENDLNSISYLNFSFYPQYSDINFKMGIAVIVDVRLAYASSETFFRSDTECVLY